MTRVRFLYPDGSLAAEVTGAPGASLLKLAQDAGMPLEGTCGGQMACSTCHVHVAAEDAAAFPPPAEQEEDMLDFAPGADRHSRLACQLRLPPGLPALSLRIAAAFVDRRRPGAAG